MSIPRRRAIDERTCSASSFYPLDPAAFQMKADIIILYEKAARRVAADRGLTVTGTLGVLGDPRNGTGDRPPREDAVSIFSRLAQRPVMARKSSLAVLIRSSVQAA